MAVPEENELTKLFYNEALLQRICYNYPGHA